MVNEDFEEFIKTEGKHKSKYVGSTHQSYKEDDSSNTRKDTDMSVGATGRDVMNERD
ncbi:hypothetical protein [Bacillus weihaiensis]|uniref:hypothetical protein n=1 Tax=Bacillus weihaiensis TaxID=1547283 RepID=UPI0013140E5A|nr:hypothetical protein [Bacillus weihaiensis]